MIKFALAKEHFLYFERNQQIELEGILTPLQVNQLKSAIHRLLALSYPAGVEEQFKNGRDLWRRDPLIQKIVTDKGLAKITSELIGGKFLRLGYDQLLPSAMLKEKTTPQPTGNAPYARLLETTTTLEEISCIQGVLCGLCICLNSSTPTEQTPKPPSFSFPQKIGNILFFSSSKSIDFSELKKHPDKEFLLIVYAAKTALYIPNESDAHQHAFKKLGYVFGDRLNDQLNPVVCRT